MGFFRPDLDSSLRSRLQLVMSSHMRDGLRDWLRDGLLAQAGRATDSLALRIAHLRLGIIRRILRIVIGLGHRAHRLSIVNTGTGRTDRTRHLQGLYTRHTRKMAVQFCSLFFCESLQKNMINFNLGSVMIHPPVVVEIRWHLGIRIGHNRLGRPLAIQ